MTKFVANEPTVSAARTFRARKAPKRCPTCNTDLAEFARDDAPLPVNHAMAAQISGFQQELRQAQESISAETEAREAAEMARAMDTVNGVTGGASDGDRVEGVENAPCAENGQDMRGAAAGKAAARTTGGSREALLGKRKAVRQQPKPPAPKTSPSKVRGSNKALGVTAGSINNGKLDEENSDDQDVEADDEMHDGSSGSGSEDDDSGDDWGVRRAKAVPSPGRAEVATARQKLRSSSRSPEKAESTGGRGKATKDTAPSKVVKATTTGRVQKKAAAGKQGAGKGSAKAVRNRGARAGRDRNSVMEDVVCSGDEN